MTIIYEDIDPDGDILIITSYPTVHSQTADGSVPTNEHAAEQLTVGEDPASSEEVAPIEATIDEPAVAYEPDYRVDHSIFSKTHGINHRHQGNEPVSQLRLKVSKKHLTVASRRARRMFQGEYVETQKSEVDGFYHWKIEPLFDPEALKTVLRIIHAQTQDLPDDVTLEMLTQIAKVVDDLDCPEALSFFVKIWTARFSQPLPCQMCDELVQWIFIASVFGLSEKFKQATRVAIIESTERMNSVELPIFPGIIDKIEQKRQDLLQDLIDRLHAVLDSLCSGYPCRVSQCSFMMLGALTKQMHDTNLSPRPARPFPNLSLSSALATARCFESPFLYIPSGYRLDYSSDTSIPSVPESQESVWVLQKDIRSVYHRKKKERSLFEPKDDELPDNTPTRLVVQHCCLQPLLEPEIDLLEARALTIGLDGI
jgi:hypothetical protein